MLCNLIVSKSRCESHETETIQKAVRTATTNHESSGVTEEKKCPRGITSFPPQKESSRDLSIGGVMPTEPTTTLVLPIVLVGLPYRATSRAISPTTHVGLFAPRTVMASESAVDAAIPFLVAAPDATRDFAKSPRVLPFIVRGSSAGY